MELEEVGGFKLNTYLTAEEIPTHGGCRELAVRENNASEEDYAGASRFLREEYVPKAIKKRWYVFSSIYNHFILPTSTAI